MADENVRIEGLQEQLAAMTRRAEAAEEDMAAADERVATLEAELAAEKAKLKDTKKKLGVERAAKPPEPRKLGVMKPPRNEDEAAARAEALDQAFAAHNVEVAFSDGKREIRELAPLTVPRTSWRETAQGRILDHEPLLEPGDCVFDSLELRGFALVDGDGRQVAYQALPEAMTLKRNHRYQLPRNTIRF